MSHFKTIDCTKGVNIDKLADRIVAFLNDEEVLATGDTELGATVLLPSTYPVAEQSFGFAPRATKAGVLEVLNTVFAEPQREVAVPVEEPAEAVDTKPKKSKKTKTVEASEEIAPTEDPTVENQPTEQ